MKLSLVLPLLLLATAGCPPTPPAPQPVPVDASDGSAPQPVPSGPPDAAVTKDSSPPSFDAAGATPDCLAACQAFAAAGCPQLPDCPAVLQEAQDERIIRLPSGAPFTCKTAKTAVNPTDVKANGGSCNPVSP